MGLMLNVSRSFAGGLMLAAGKEPALPEHPHNRLQCANNRFLTACVLRLRLRTRSPARLDAGRCHGCEGAGLRPVFRCAESTDIDSQRLNTQSLAR